MVGLLVACIVLLTVLTLVLVVGVALLARRFDRAFSELERSLRSAREDISAVANDMRKSLAEFNGLMHSAREPVERADRVLTGLQRLVDGRTVVDAAGRAVDSSRAALVSAIEGVKQGIRTLRGSSIKSKEDKEDEQ